MSKEDSGRLPAESVRLQRFVPRALLWVPTTADNVPTMVLHDDLEADYLRTTDYFFDRIGDPVPIKSSPFNFDPQNPPSQPLAVSERYGLIFVAHDSGFCVACLETVMDLAWKRCFFDMPYEEWYRVMTDSESDMEYLSLHRCEHFLRAARTCAMRTGMDEMRRREIRHMIQCRNPYSVLERGIVDVPLGEVRILALSFDNSTLAASVGGDVHFFSVNLLLYVRELNPSFSRSLNESSNVKDIRWRTKSDNSFLVLSELGKLYHGNVDGYFENAMDNVDAFEWSIDGDYIVVAKENDLSILSSEFEERSSMVLLFNSWIGDSDANRTVKVDSIRWVRRDSIIVGCFQLTEDGREENYLVQVIRSNDGNFSDEPIIISCRDLFPTVVDDILPFGRGPYLLASYLEQCELAIVANKKSTDQHIVYLGWSLGEEKDEVAVIDIERDTRLPRIELQENDDDNLILGMCTSRLPGNMTVIVRPGGHTVLLSSCCVLMCLTVEGKLVIFNVSRSP